MTTRHALPPPLPPAAFAAETRVLSALLTVQGAIGAAAALETTVVMITLGSPLLVPLVASVLGSALSLWAALRVDQRRTLIVLVQVLWITGAGVDLLLSVLLAHRGFGLVPALTRVLLPGLIVWLARRPTLGAGSP